MVGSWGLEPQTSTASKRRDQVLPTTWEALGERLSLVRRNTCKPEILQVKLQMRNSARTAPTMCEAHPRIILFCPALSALQSFCREVANGRRTGSARVTAHVTTFQAQRRFQREVTPALNAEASRPAPLRDPCPLPRFERRSQQNPLAAP